MLSVHDRSSRADGRRSAFAQFRSVPIAGTWPCGINIWENTWAGQAGNLVRQFEDAKRDTAMEEWWNRNLHLRRGGYDRMLIPAPCSPTLADLEARGIRGEVFLHEILWLPFGEPRRYLESLEEQLVPELDGLGLDLVGAFRVAMRPRQVLSVVGARDWSGLAAMLDPARSDSELEHWHTYRAKIVERSETLLLLPARHGPLVAERR